MTGFTSIVSRRSFTFGLCVRSQLFSGIDSIALQYHWDNQTESNEIIIRKRKKTSQSNFLRKVKNRNKNANLNAITHIKWKASTEKQENYICSRKKCWSIFILKSLSTPGAFYQKFDLRIIFTKEYFLFSFPFSSFFIRRFVSPNFPLTNIYFKLKKFLISLFDDRTEDFICFISAFLHCSRARDKWTLEEKYSRSPVFTGIFLLIGKQKQHGKLRRENVYLAGIHNIFLPCSQFSLSSPFVLLWGRVTHVCLFFRFESFNIQGNKSITKGKVYPCSLYFAVAVAAHGERKNVFFFRTQQHKVCRLCRMECKNLIRMFTSSTIIRQTISSTQKA